MFVHRSLLADFTDRLVSAVGRLKIGDPMADDTTVGATIHEAHAKRVLAYIHTAVEQVGHPHGGAGGSSTRR